MADELARRNVARLGDRGATAMLVTLMSIMSEAVLVFGDDGIITLANDEAERLFRRLPGGLVDSDVRQLFMPPPTVSQASGPLAESLPFPTNGSTVTVVCEGSDNYHKPLRLRCERLSIPDAPYLLVAHPSDVQDQESDERERLVSELSRANRRLSGTLRIVLETLDSLDVGTLFSRILGEVCEAVDAWAAIAYVAEHGGYRLSNATATLDGSPIPALLSFAHPLASLVASEGRTLRFGIRHPSRQMLRSGDLSKREVIDEETGDTLEVEAALLPPFGSFVMIPIWFGGHVISLLEVGWRHAKHIDKDDAKLLDSVAEYLSVQLAGAFAAMRAQHADHLESLGTLLRERLLSGAPLTSKTLDGLFGEAAQAIGAMCVPLAVNVHQRTTMADLPHMGIHSIPLDLTATSRANDVPVVLPLETLPELCDWLTRHNEPAAGVLVVLGLMDQKYRAFLMLQDEGDEPFGDVDLNFLRGLAQDVVEVRAGEQARTIDKRISQALQLGMRNELQHVQGLSTQSRYSSATEAAFVGGDFYDLIRLPNNQACVIMGDVSGKGVEAASVSSAVRTALGAYAWEGLRPARMVGLLNDFLLGFSRIETFATMFVGMIDLEEGTLVYCSAGHPPAILVRAATGELETLGVQSGVVGAFENMRYQDGEVRWNRGDVLLLYTDGTTEARNPQGAFFGEEGLRDAVSREMDAGFDGLCDRLLDAVSTFAGNSLEDDVAMVVVRFDGV